jgi:hypothetical protein
VLMRAAASSRVERIAAARAGRSEARGGKAAGVSGVVVQLLMGPVPPFLFSNGLPVFVSLFVLQ